MKVFAVVFTGDSGRSKRRLSAGFSPEERKLLSAAMIEDVLAALKSSVVSDVVVVGTDSTVGRVVDKCGVSFISQGQTGLASGVRKAIKWCVESEADAVLVLPGNIPLASSKDIDEIAEIGSQESSVVVSPSLDCGINALFLNPPNVIQACFGPSCFFKNVAVALKKNVPLKFHSSRGLALNVALEEDLQKLLAAENSSRSRQVFQQIKLQRNKKK